LIKVNAGARSLRSLFTTEKETLRMNDIPHELHGSFPQYADKIDALEASDPAFAKLLSEYNAVNEKVHKAETLEKPVDHFHEEEMKKQRVALRDEIYRRLSAE
jgi:uncharacterized protein YdcH (DUF465 family)